MKKSPPFSLVAILATVVLLAACKKEDHPNAPHNWRISKVNFYPGISGSGDEAVFAYNSKGNPVSITRSAPGTGATNSIFRYDGQHRLKDYAGVYDGGIIYEFWTRYYHDSQGRIAGDTTYHFGRVGEDGPLPDPDAPPPYNQLYIGSFSTYHYDGQNRLIKTVKTFGIGSPYSITYDYTYNAKGNLAKMTLTYSTNPEWNTETVYDQYDQKVNLHRTHPVWQFIDADFSRNNRMAAQRYNAQGLPLKFVVPDAKENGSFLSLLYNTLEITYQSAH
jgi:hypothetical protein